jgi:hypothetical protein
MASAVGKKFINKSENVVEEMVQVCQRQAAVPQRAAWLRRRCVFMHAPGLALPSAWGFARVKRE